MAVFLLWGRMVWLCISLAYFSVGTCILLYLHIRGVFPECCISDGPVSGMADFCRLPESVYRTLELTEHLPHKMLSASINSANIIIIYSEKAGISAKLVFIFNSLMLY